jgi:hypothetical protein
MLTWIPWSNSGWVKRGVVNWETLVGVEDLTLSPFQEFPHSLNAKVRVQRGAQLPAQHIAAVPVDHRHQVYKP